MKRPAKIVGLLVVLALLAGLASRPAAAGKPAPPPPPPPISYVLTFIAPPAGMEVDFRDLIALNSHGDMIGYLTSAAGEAPFVYVSNTAGGGSFQLLQDLLSEEDALLWELSFPTAINDGPTDADPRIPEIACRATYWGEDTEATDTTPALKHGGMYSSLLSITGELVVKSTGVPTNSTTVNGFPVVWDLNDSADRCGWVPVRNTDHLYPRRAFVMSIDDASPTYLFGSPFDPSAPDSWAVANNNSGQAIGRLLPGHGFRYTPGTANTPPATVTLGRIGAAGKNAIAEYNEPSAINSSGQFCGTVAYGSALVAYRYTDGVGMEPLLSNSSGAYGIDDRGDVLGDDVSASARSNGVTYHHGAFVHLQSANKLAYLSTVGVVTGAAADLKVWNDPYTEWQAAYWKMNKSGVIAGAMLIDLPAADRSKSGYIFVLRPK